MKFAPDKAKQFLIATAKLLIVGAAFYFIYRQVAHNSKLEWSRFMQQTDKNLTFAGALLILALSFTNRFFEILKWQQLTSVIRRIGIGEATQQVMGSLTAGVFTPNGIGEYAGKALFFEKTHAKKVVFLNLVCNGIQMGISVIFGVFGLFYFNAVRPFISGPAVIWIFAAFIMMSVLLFLLRKWTLKGYSLEKLVHKVNSIPKKIHARNTLLAFGRYISFTHQQYFLFLLFDVHLPYVTVISVIMAVYFLASCLPTFQFLDFAVKGGVSVYFFGLLGVNEWIVLLVIALMWLLNVVVPVLIGSYFVLNFKLKK